MDKSETEKSLSTETSTSNKNNNNNNDNHNISESTQNSKKRKKKLKPFHGIHTHSNPLNDNRFLGTPYSPDEIDWSQFYPSIFHKLKTEQPPTVENDSQEKLQQEIQQNLQHSIQPVVRFADIGCGFGGLLVGLPKAFPDTLILGMEIRDKAVEYVHQRIENLREINSGSYQNIAVVRTNCMKYLPNYFTKGQLTKMFFLYPDPHFKAANHRRRIISQTMLAEYAYLLTVGGIAYTITDVEELHIWMVTHFEQHPLFQRVSNDDLKEDITVGLVKTASEEAKKSC